DAWAMTRRAGSHFVIGYGGIVEGPTIEIISTERNVIGNIVGTYNDLAELMALAAQGKVTLHTKPYPLEAANDAITDLAGADRKGAPDKGRHVRIRRPQRLLGRQPGEHQEPLRRRVHRDVLRLP